MLTQLSNVEGYKHTEFRAFKLCYLAVFEVKTYMYVFDQIVFGGILSEEAGRRFLQSFF